jgi:hypothetical protein
MSPSVLEYGIYARRANSRGCEMAGDEPGGALERLATWRPHGAESNVHEYRRSIAAHLGGAPDGDDRSGVTVDRGAATPDLVVGADAGIFVEPTITENGQGRLRTRLDRFTEAYDRLVVVAIEVRDQTAWTRLRRDYTATDGTTFDFITAPEPDPSRQPPEADASGTGATAADADSSDGRFNTDPPAGEPPSLRALFTGVVGVVFWLAVLGLVGSVLFVFYSWTTPAVPAAWVDRAKAVLFGSFVVAVGIIRLATNSTLRD